VYGYRPVPVIEAGRRVRVERAIAPEEAAVVRRIFELAASGLGCKRIAATLNDEAVPATIPRRVGRPRGWAPSGVRTPRSAGRWWDCASSYGAITVEAGARSSSKPVSSIRSRHMPVLHGPGAHGKRCSEQPAMRCVSLRAQILRRAIGRQQTSHHDR
jgi:hypothetical protein